MNKLKTYKYGLLALVVFGCFANFAHNRYGFQIVLFSLIFLSLVFFIEAIIGKIKRKSSYIFSESFFISLFIAAWVIKFLHWPGAGLTVILSGGSMAIIYLVQGFREFKRTSQINLRFALLILSVFAACAFGFIGFVFKVQHYPGASIMLYINIFLFPLIAILSLFKYKYDDTEIRFAKYLRKLKGNIALILVIFTIMVTYTGFSLVGISPSFYSLANPPVMEELRTAAAIGGEKERAIYDKYEDDYRQFINKRWRAK